MHGRIRRPLIALGLVATTLAVPASVEAAAAPKPKPTKLTESVSVTLVTGDEVTVRHDGLISVKAARRPDGREPDFSVQRGNGKLSVIPGDAMRLVRDGRLDRALFDVEVMRRYGFGAGKPIPLISTFGTKVSELKAQGQGLAGSGSVRELSSVHAAALTVTAKNTRAFWKDVTKAGATARDAQFDESVERLVLDRPVKALLDKSVPQVHAPEAWAAGYDGTGVKVAVLDTGIDETHPDLTGKVVASQSFVPGQTVVDGHGHGTHVASTIAGTGATYKGVAPGAKLVVGKVLGDSGSGSVSGIIDGMEWAVGQGARVVSMSLGGTAPEYEADDLMAKAVNDLTTSSGALFVVAAGNDGPKANTINTPGTAAAALTVGAVDSGDRTADFSSRGPLPYAFPRVAKPDIAAPGVGIVAARAKGTSMGTPVDAGYTRASGTSMATPHVAGAAAVLAQKRTGWKAAQLKNALMGAADDVGGTAFTQGSGRLNVVKSLDQTVTSGGSLDFGRVDQPSNTTVTRKLAYTSARTTATTLTLRASLWNAATGTPVPSGVLTVPGSVPVPAGGTGEVDTSLNPTQLDVGAYTGVVTATDTDGKVTRTAIAFMREPQTVRLTAFVNDRNGSPCPTSGYLTDCIAGEVNITSLDNPAWSTVAAPGQGVRVRPGKYAISSNVSWVEGRESHVAVLVKPEFTVAMNEYGAQGVQLSLGQAKKVQVKTDKPSQNYNGTLLFSRQANGTDFEGGWITGYTNSSMWALPSRAVTVGRYLLKPTLERGAIPITAKVVGDGTELHPRYQTYAAIEPKFAAQSRAKVVDVGDTLEPAEATAVRGAIALAKPPYIPILDSYGSYLDDELEAQLAAAGAVGVLVWSPDMEWGVPSPSASGSARKLPVAGLTIEEGDDLTRRIEAGPVELDVTSISQSPYMYTLKFYERQSVGTLSYTVTDSALSQVPADYRVDGDGNWPLWRDNAALWPAEGEYSTFAAASLLVAPAKITQLYGPVQSGVVWGRWLHGHNSSVDSLGHRQSPLPAGVQPTEIWYQAPRLPGAASSPHPSLVRTCANCRQGDTLEVQPTLTQPDPSVVADPGLPGSSYLFLSGLKLFNGTQEIPRRAAVGYQTGLFTVPSTPTTLRMTYDRAAADAPVGLKYGRELHSEWTFRSERPTAATTKGNRCDPSSGLSDPCGVQPLLQVTPRATLNERNQVARSGAQMGFVAYKETSTATPAAVTSMTVSASYDNGATWTPVTLSGSGGTRLGTLPDAPAGATTVSLRIEAADADGNTVKHQLPQAFGLVG